MYDLELGFLLAQQRVNQRIDEAAMADTEYFANWDGFKPVWFDPLKHVDSFLKKKGYQKYGNLYTKGFVVFEVVEKTGENPVIFVWQDFGAPKRKQRIEVSIVTGVIIAANYYERI